MDIKIRPGALQGAIEEILRNYGDVVFTATNEALGAAEKVLIKNLKASSPAKDGEYKKSWKGQKYKLMRAVHNTKTVENKSGKEIPLSNILEYSPHSPHQGLVKRTYESSINEMAAAVVEEIKREV